MTDPHADLRAMLAVHPESYIITNPPSAPVFSWLKNAPALVRDLMKERDKLVEHLRALLEERDKMAEQLAARPRADVYVTAASHNDAMRALERERDKLADEVGQLSGDAEWLSEINEALGDDRNRAPFIDDAVRLLRKERDALKAEVEKLRAAKPAEDAKAPSVIRSLMEEVAWLADLRPDIDALIAEARRRKEAGK